MDKIKITKAQEKILMIVGVVSLAFLIFILFIYLPSRRQLVRLKNEFYGIESEIENIKKATGEGRSLEENITILKARLDELDKKFPAKEEVILRELSDAAARYDIAVTALKPQKKKVIKDIDGISIMIKDCQVQEMPVSLSLKASYKTLGEFLKFLKDQTPVFVRIDNVRMAKGSDKMSAIIDVELNLNSYLIIYSEAK